LNRNLTEILTMKRPYDDIDDGTKSEGSSLRESDGFTSVIP